MNKRLCLCAVLFLGVVPLRGQGPSPAYSLGSVTPYLMAQPSNSDVIHFRRGERYNLPHSSIPELGENSEPTLLDLPASHGEPDALPMQRSDAVVVATVQSGQSFLSNDKKNIYSEYRATVEDVLKSSSTRYLRTGDSIDVEREGGAVKLSSGKTLVRGKVTDSKPVVGGCYVFFLKYDADTEDYHIETAYQLHAGKAFRLDDKSYTENARDKTSHPLQIEANNSDEFLKQVRAKAQKGGNE